MFEHHHNLKSVVKVLEHKGFGAAKEELAKEIMNISGSREFINKSIGPGSDKEGVSLYTILDFMALSCKQYEKCLRDALEAPNQEEFLMNLEKASKFLNHVISYFNDLGKKLAAETK